MEALGVGKKKKRVRRSEEVPTQNRKRETGAEETSVGKGREVEGVPGRVGGPEAVKVGSEGMEVVPVVATIAVGVTEAAPEGQMGDEAAGPEPRREEQPEGGPTPQAGGVSLNTAIYHARAIAGRLEGEEGPTRAEADRLVRVVEEAALRSASRFNEAELLRGLYSAQMEVTTLAGALLRKAGAAKLKEDEVRAQLAKLKKKSASWESAHTELQAVKKELERERAKAVEEKERLQKELEVERVQATAEKESLKKELEAERAKAASERSALQKELDEERVKAASEREAYPDLCVAAVEQFKGSAEFQTAVDAVVASSLVGQESGGVGPSRTTTGSRTDAEVIASFQQSDFYKYEMVEYWDSGWKMFKHRAEELFPGLDLSSVTIGENDVAQTPLEEGIEEEDLFSSGEE
ncbi:uncharacterized protein LOC114260133 [Camellia sinensis]|uniref:uncharacterized protein LOC114260133 n=1 Tax=Camellia sinensis TaxID=4442 RepID=UPI001036E1F8|nr:uncharacterized protein LOC114260133 [Camellia sinensis]